MLHRHIIENSAFGWIKALPGQPGHHGKVPKDHCLLLDAVLGIAETGAPWRDVPACFGPRNSVWRRFDRWAQKGMWLRVFEALGRQTSLTG